MARSRSTSRIRALAAAENDPSTVPVDPRSSVNITSYKNQQLKDDEASPLLRPAGGSQEVDRPPSLALQSPTNDGHSDYEQQWRTGISRETKGTGYMFLLTIGMAGLQMGWSVELAYGSPYLLSLGITKAMLALVWIAGPLSGVIVQPYIGSKSDRCRSRFGKRRPFIVGGALATILALLALAWTKELIAGFFSIFGVHDESQFVKNVALAFAVVMIYVLDFAINVYQAANRAFIVDCAPVHQQSQANAWASRISGAANILGFMFGYVKLPAIFPWLGDTEFKVLCVITVLAIAATVGVSVVSIKERDARLDKPPPKQKRGPVAFCTSLYHSARRLPLQVKRVCQVQFLAWIGWFPFLFYSTTFISNIYIQPFLQADPDMSAERLDELSETGTRLATFALMIYAIVTLSCSIVLPQIIQRTMQGRAQAASTPLTPRPSHEGVFANGQPLTRPSNGNVILAWLKQYKPSIRIPGLTLRRMYIMSHVLFAIIIWIASLSRTVRFATVMIAMVGIPWAVTYWAPFALIAAEVSKRDAIRRGSIEPPPTEDGQMLARGQDPTEGADQAGIVLGIHNVCISAPQILATLISSVLFKLLQKPRGVPGDDSVAWVFRLSGFCALAAAYWSCKIIEDDFVVDEDTKTLGHGGH